MKLGRSFHGNNAKDSIQPKEGKNLSETKATPAHAHTQPGCCEWEPQETPLPHTQGVGRGLGGTWSHPPVCSGCPRCPRPAAASLPERPSSVLRPWEQGPQPHTRSSCSLALLAWLPTCTCSHSPFIPFPFVLWPLPIHLLFPSHHSPK